MNLKKIMAAVAITGAFGFTALGLGAGMANAVPTSPGTPGTTWPQDGDWWGHGHGHGHGHWGGGDDWHGGWGGGDDWHGGWGGGWGVPGWGWGVPGWGWGGPVACGSVGWASGCIG
jgi:hypothetical protein